MYSAFLQISLLSCIHASRTVEQKEYTFLPSVVKNTGYLSLQRFIRPSARLLVVGPTCGSAPCGGFVVVQTCCTSHCLFISQPLSYGALAVRNFRPDYGRCGPLGIHCTLRGNHLYSTPEVTEEHEIGKRLKHHSACEA